jgi:tryptophanyl-tRNA synthetase
MYPMILQIQKLVKLKQVLATFGFDGDNATTSIGKVSFPAIQAAPAFAETFKTMFCSSHESNLFDEKKIRKVYCLIPCAIDQDPYFRLCRGIASNLKHHKPAVIHTKFLPSLDGVETKMSASNPKSCIYLGDSAKQIRKKIASAFSGGQEFLHDHRRLGGNPDKDVAYSLLTFFSKANESDLLKNLSDGFKAGTVSCGDMKNAAANVVVQIVSDFKDVRSKITNDTVNKFTDSAKKLGF